jgi:hypothetical protein
MNTIKKSLTKWRHSSLKLKVNGIKRDFRYFTISEILILVELKKNSMFSLAYS